MITHGKGRAIGIALTQTSKHHPVFGKGFVHVRAGLPMTEVADACHAVMYIG
jgi:hypothetical protein